VSLIGTLALASVVLFLGHQVRRLVPVLDRYNIPTPVVGGLLAAIVLTIARARGLAVPTLDTTLQQPLMIAFFTTLGFAASFRLLRAGGSQVVVLLALTSVYAIVQSLAGMGVAYAFGLPPLFGVLTGAVSLTGGPATSLAFAPMFEQAGIVGAAPLALATAMAGIVLGGVAGAPIATMLIERFGLRTPGPAAAQTQTQDTAPARERAPVAADDYFVTLKGLSLILLAMWAGSQVSALIQSAGITMPAYVGSMLVAGVLRNIDDAFGWPRLPLATMDSMGTVALTFFLIIALMNLNLLELTNLAAPLLVNLAVQVLLVVLVCCWPVYQLMGRDYDAAVMCGGFTGFMLGTTANAMAVMRSLVERYGIAPRAFLVAPLVGAFFLDFTNAIIITLFVNIFS
jgi:glutamate:Na+ symporter, ESS family